LVRTKEIATFSAMRYIHVENVRVVSYFGNDRQSCVTISCATSSRSAGLRQYVAATLKTIPRCRASSSANCASAPTSVSAVAVTYHSDWHACAVVGK
jgi:hypothetical protein